MDIVSILICTAAAALLGGLVGALIARAGAVSVKEHESLRASLEVAQSAVADRETRLERLHAEKADVDAKYIALVAETASLQTTVGELRNLREDSKTVFENIANEILEKKTKIFTDLNSRNLDGILQPFDKELKEFKERIEKIHNEQTAQKASLMSEVKNLSEQTGKVSAEANNLASALKSNTKTQGQWGELLLEALLERAGFQKGSHFRVQTVLRDEDGNRQIPDVIINLPDNRCVVVDSKVSLQAYDAFCAADTEEERRNLLEAHVTSIRNHYNGLGSRSYETLGELKDSVDFVLMFVPIEPAYILAMKERPELWDEAYKKNVIIVSPTNLFAVIKLVDDLWKRDTQVKNTQKIAEQGRKLYDKFIGFLESLDTVGDSLRKAQGSYEEAVNRLRMGRGNAVKLAQELSELGGRISTKEMPSRFLDNEDGDADNLLPPATGAVDSTEPGV